jgi:repressor LexA
MSQELTGKQRRIYEFVEDYASQSGFCPTLREIGGRFRVSVGTAYEQANALVSKGFLVKDAKQRARPYSLARPKKKGIPLYGRVGAGSGIIAQEDLQAHLELGDVGAGADFILRIRGDSMQGAGMLEGDFVQVRRQTDASDGDIVVAVVGEDGVVKRLRKSPTRLESASPNYPDITEPFYLFGRVVGLFRRYARQ